MNLNKEGNNVFLINSSFEKFPLHSYQNNLFFAYSMASMLAKFRIDYSDLKVIPDITKKPQPSTTNFFENLIQDLRVPDENSKQDCKDFNNNNNN